MKYRYILTITLLLFQAYCICAKSDEVTSANILRIRPLTNPVKDEPPYYLIKFHDEAKTKAFKEMEKEGAVHLGHLPNGTNLYKIPDKGLLKKHLKSIQESLPFEKQLFTYKKETVDKGKYILTVDVSENEEFEDHLNKSGIEIQHASKHLPLKIYTVIIDTNAQKSIFDDNRVLYIEEKLKYELHNDVSTHSILKIDESRADYGLYGASQIVCVCDTGIDNGENNPAEHHIDFTDGAGNSRILNIFDLSGHGANDKYGGHGTHVSGSVLGNGMQSGAAPSTHHYPQNCFAGSAPEAKLIMQAIQGQFGLLTGLPEDLNVLFDQAYEINARIHTNSWGSDVSGSYTSDSREVDEFAVAHEDMLILFSAGNEGTDQNQDGHVDAMSIDSPGTAKNCLTIGASENYRFPTDNESLYGSAWPSDFPATPIKEDLIDNNPSGMVAFSSRGPTLDNRYKPELVAPGTNIISVLSQDAAYLFSNKYNDHYLYMSGTSMATPLAAGCSAILREYLQLKKGISTPTATLLKAAMINSATDMSPGQYGLTDPELISAPDFQQGFGRINMENTLEIPDNLSAAYFDNQSVSQGESCEFKVYVKNQDQPLKATLCWHDPPSTGAGGLINNLDMEIISSDGSTYRPENPQAGRVAQPFNIQYDDGISEGSDLKEKDTGYTVRFTNTSNQALVTSISVGLNILQAGEHRFFVRTHTSLPLTGEPDSKSEKYVYAYPNFEQTGEVWVDIAAPQGIVLSPDQTLYVSFLWDNNDENIQLLYDSNGSFLPGNNFTSSYSFTGGLTLGDQVEGKQYFIRPSLNEYIEVETLSGQDTANNVEKIILPTPQEGSYTIRIKGDRITSGENQKFSVVASGNILSKTTVQNLYWMMY